MTVMSPVMPRERHDWTVEDLDRLPDDGLQYELLDGLLLVTPAPVPRHQRALLRLAIVLTKVCPDDCEVFVAPLDWQPDRRTSLQPDVLVVRRDQVGPKSITANLMLAVEVLSPSTRRKDIVLKHSKYEDVGVASYWVVDPAGPSIEAYDLVDGAYVEVARTAGDQVLDLHNPFPVSISPVSLVEA